ncbi:MULTISPECIES: chloride channel protein [unclassified Crossiella]|uniref:chloride channel protein n=1 Tax=unclassified Crossiella TaxID=2620835 RepID=UPI001FFF2DF6|nr:MULTISPECIES: chloride channel protein [unclassified Crossiella]MCK2240765.1 chloride channel protein [Crossiella sp. S99.2]MCK2254091.1 chloride channel protein [Crossiella sp. S99.1]
MITLLAVVAAVLLVAARRRAKRTLRPLPAPRRGRRRLALIGVIGMLGLQIMVGGVAHAQSICKESPNPDRPGSGMVGAFDAAPLGTGVPGSAYDEVGYAGHVWHTYDLGCGPEGLRNPNAVIDTWAGNQTFNMAKVLVGATNGLHYALLGGELMKPLDDLVSTGTIALYDTVYAPWFGLAALILAIFLFRHIWQGDLASIGKRSMWALAAIWLAAATYLTPLLYTRLLDDVLIKGTSQIQAGFLREVGVDERNSLPTVLHDQVIYRNWLRGEFGSPDSTPAKDFGRDLLRAQTFTKQEVAEGKDQGKDPIVAKKAAFEGLVARADEVGAKGHIQGIDGSRMGAGALGLFQSVVYSLFQLLAKAAILLAQVLLRVVILAGPIIGLIAMLYHAILRGVGRAIGAALLNVVVIAALAGLHTLLLTWIFAPTRGLGLLAQMALAGLVTLVFFLVGKPVRRIWQMVELSVGAVGNAMPAPRTGLWSRLRGRGGQERTPQDEFWEQVRDVDPDGGTEPRRARRRDRPEASYEAAGPGGFRGDASGGALPVAGALTGTVSDRLHESGGGALGVNRAAGALPSGRGSRTVDTAPVFDRSWDRNDEDAVVVPSRLNNTAGSAPGPRRADMEVVAGRPVWAVYRPSRGVELRDGDAVRG